MPILPAFAAAVTAGQTFTCTAYAVWDGDGPIWCAEGPKIRLAGIAAREIDGRCNPGHPCPRRSGVEARDHLVLLLGGARGRLGTGHVAVGPKRLSCVSMGSGKGERTAAFCSLGRVDLSCAMVRDGYALRWARYGGARVCRPS